MWRSVCARGAASQEFIHNSIFELGIGGNARFGRLCNSVVFLVAGCVHRGSGARVVYWKVDKRLDSGG